MRISFVGWVLPLSIVTFSFETANSRAKKRMSFSLAWPFSG